MDQPRCRTASSLGSRCWGEVVRLEDQLDLRPFICGQGVAVPAAAQLVQIFAIRPLRRSGHAHELPLADDNRATIPDFQEDRLRLPGRQRYGGVGVSVAPTRAAW